MLILNNIHNFSKAFVVLIHHLYPFTYTLSIYLSITKLFKLLINIYPTFLYTFLHPRDFRTNLIQVVELVLMFCLCWFDAM